jgi:hypothetical protein
MATAPKATTKPTFVDIANVDMENKAKLGSIWKIFLGFIYKTLASADAGVNTVYRSVQVMDDANAKWAYSEMQKNLTRFQLPPK